MSQSTLASARSLILERVRIAAGRQESLFQMLSADDAEKGRRDRLAIALHRREQLSDATLVDPVDAEKTGQGLMRTAAPVSTRR